ncbi:MAG TPA: hypothetical protein VKY74_01420 [Chloroflexia bacterium]|nr:hypothetical protein [Chloroflexia bacterium]
MGGFLIGWGTGVVTLLALAAVAVHLAPIGSPVAGETDVRLAINIRYLNDVVQRRLAANPPVAVAEIKTRSLQLGLLPQAGMVLTPTFDVAGLFAISPSVTNQLAVQDGKLAMTMIGDPRLGDLQVPLDVLPFDLAGEVRQAVDKITNDVLLAELNTNLKAGFGNDAFTVVEVQTEGNYLLVKLERK